MFYIFMVMFVSCVNSVESKKNILVSHNDTFPNSYTWTKLSDSAEWKKNYNFQMLNIHDTLWTLHPDGNWYSIDGINWMKSPLPNSIHNLAFLDYVYFKSSVYGLGYFEGNIEEYIFKPIITKTSNFIDWTVISENSNLPKRFFYHPFVFENKIWIIGGEDKDMKYSDIWNSTDGIFWIKQSENLPFGKRSGSQIVILNDKLYLLDHDVWISNDALNWELLSEEIVKGEKLFGYSALIFDHKIWLIGCNRNGQFSSQVLFSSDGKNWQTQNAPWLTRGGVAATLYKDKILMTGGKYGGTPNHPNFRYDNDIWICEKK